MSQITTTAVIGLCAALVAGCSSALNDAREITPTGSDFARELHKGYVQLAQRELDETDFTDAYAFALRARSAGIGNPEAPESLDLRNIPAGPREGLVRARARLVTALDGGGRTKVPGDAARAQLMFECWAQEQEENLQAKDIAACRGGFEAAIVSVEAALEPQKAETAPTAKSPATVTDMTRQPEPRVVRVSANAATTAAPKTKFTVLFDLGAADVKDIARQTIDDAVAAARVLGATVIKVSGHADRSGTANYNRGLSAKRAGTIAGMITQLDGARRKVETDARGEADPAVATADGITEPRNRRVEIELIN